jgi:glycosyltransferase involved in cell wall biosynthesis
MSGITVVIPCYNSRPFIEECLRSVLAQSHPNWEAIVIDDCSTDGGPAAVITALADPRIRLIRHPQNRGLGAARNTGFAAARFPLVLPLDADDLVAPTFLANVGSLLHQDATLDCAYPDFELFGARTGIWCWEVKPAATLTEYQWLPGAGVLMRHRLWQRAGGYSEADELRRGNEDWDFWFAAAKSGFRAARWPESLYRYRQHPQSMSHDLDKADYLTRRFMLARHREFIETHGTARRFLAGGFWRPAAKAKAQGRVAKSLWLTFRALAIDGNWRQAKRLTCDNLRQLRPSAVLSRVKSVIRRAGPALPRPPTASTTDRRTEAPRNAS